MLRYGFTGTQEGLTEQQYNMLDAFVSGLDPTSAVHHGDCIGADAAFDEIAHRYNLVVVVHPPDNRSKRAWCDGDTILPSKPYLRRNKDIVDSCDMMIATPRGFEEELRSGTWSTIRYARKIGRSGLIIWPNGELSQILSQPSGVG